MAKKEVKFNPHYPAGAIKGLGTGGINWSYHVFPTQQAASDFAKECSKNGYRTRNMHIENGNWAIQYHHYQD